MCVFVRVCALLCVHACCVCALLCVHACCVCYCLFMHVVCFFFFFFFLGIFFHFQLGLSPDLRRFNNGPMCIMFCYIYDTRGSVVKMHGCRCSCVLCVICSKWLYKIIILFNVNKLTMYVDFFTFFDIFCWFFTLFDN